MSEWVDGWTKPLDYQPGTRTLIRPVRPDTITYELPIRGFPKRFRARLLIRCRDDGRITVRHLLGRATA